jgi:sterol desaturase/sphingolipid hydroxylase (fatty acid hydroxylase superfamily)
MDIKPLLITITLITIFVLEGVFPHYQDRVTRLRHGLPHVLTAIMNGLLTRFALGGLTIGAIAWAQAGSLISLYVFRPVSFVETAFVFVLFDIWMYLWHKANHCIGFLWRFHRAHHSDTDMDTTTALRFHPGELILSTLARLPVVLLLGMSITQLVLFETILNLSTLFHHSNLAVPEKWDRLLRTVITTPNMHRVHHSIELAETNSNFTSILSLWDRLFNTFRTRKDTRAITLGLPQYREDNYQRLWGFLKTPFL